MHITMIEQFHCLLLHSIKLVTIDAGKFKRIYFQTFLPFHHTFRHGVNFLIIFHCGQCVLFLQFFQFSQCFPIFFLTIGFTYIIIFLAQRTDDFGTP